MSLYLQMEGLCIGSSSAAPSGKSDADCSQPKITRNFMAHASHKALGIRTHWRFEISLHHRRIPEHMSFVSALEELFNLRHDLTSFETVGSKLLISISNKEKNKSAIRFLQTDGVLTVGAIKFTASCADDTLAFVSTGAYDPYDFIAASHIMVELRGLPLHLWTIKTVDHMLQPYCIVADLHCDTSNYTDLVAFRCFCWTDMPATIPTRMMVKAKRKFTDMLGSANQTPLDMFSVLIRPINDPVQKKCSVQPLQPVPIFYDGRLDGEVPQCFLQDTEVDDDCLDLLLESLVLKHVPGFTQMDTETILLAMHIYIPDTVSEHLRIYPLNIQSYLLNCYGSSTFKAFRNNAINKGTIKLAGQTFVTSPWSTSIGSTEISADRFVRLTLSCIQPCFLQREIARQILGRFALLKDKDFPSEGEFTVYGWIDAVVQMPTYINIYIPPSDCQPRHLCTGETFMPLTMCSASLSVELAVS